MNTFSPFELDTVAKALAENDIAYLRMLKALYGDAKFDAIAAAVPKQPEDLDLLDDLEPDAGPAPDLVLLVVVIGAVTLFGLVLFRNVL